MVYIIRDFLAYMLARVGLWSHDVDEMDRLESTVEVALPPVRPSDRFRERLRDDLNLAAQHKVSGLRVEHPQPFREAILLGVSASALTIGLIAVVIIFYTRLTTSDN